MLLCGTALGGRLAGVGAGMVRGLAEAVAVGAHSPAAPDWAEGWYHSRAPASAITTSPMEHMRPVSGARDAGTVDAAVESTES